MDVSWSSDIETINYFMKLIITHRKKSRDLTFSFMYIYNPSKHLMRKHYDFYRKLV